MGYVPTLPINLAPHSVHFSAVLLACQCSDSGQAKSRVSPFPLGPPAPHILHGIEGFGDALGPGEAGDDRGESLDILQKVRASATGLV
jgi:hypothetical protein